MSRMALRLRPMDGAKTFSVLLLLLLGLVSIVAKSSSYDKDFEQCESVVQNWAFASLEEEVKEDKHTLRDLLFFLHIPRTGGRTYFHCFLRKLYPGSLECPRSYDKLRFDPRKQKCRLLVTHDDYSLISKFPKQKTSVVTILRDPIDRVFSAYEFSIEVAARFLIHPNLTSATSSVMAGRLRAKSKGVKGVSTLDIWPWKYLVPWIRKDLFDRRDARKIKGKKRIFGNDPYDMSEVVMPLGEYIQEPIVQEIVHNGATFQVAGLTNNSYTSESHEVRHCVQKYEILGDHVLQVAKKRLDDMLYVGLTEEHRESATMFANVVGSQVISQLRASNPSSSDANGRKTEASSLDSDSKTNNNSLQKSSSYQNSSDVSLSQTESNEEINQNMTVEELMDSYGQCISNLRKTQAQRRVLSLKKISPANFTKEARRRVSENVIQQILSLNHLDVELYKHAQLLFAKQHTRSNSNFAAMERLDKILKSSTSVVSWKFLTIGSIVLLATSGLLVNVRRRTSSKVKI